MFIPHEINTGIWRTEVSSKGALLACVVMGIVLIGLGSQSFMAYISQPLLSPVSATGGNQVVQVGTDSTGKIVYIVAPAGSGSTLANFSPSDVTLVIGVNNTIVLKNEDTSDHTLTSKPGDPMAFDTGDISGLSSSAPITITVPGTYGYFCQFHPSSMHGTITVLPASS